MPLTKYSSILEVMAHPVVGPIVQQQMAAQQAAMGGASIMADESLQKMMASFPIGRMAGFPGMGIDREQLAQLLGAAAAADAAVTPVR